ncbi:MAG: hypothetical protein J5J00_14320 [Deltaproteobacteria bacterium]|nr:hypothetical protein [Deltaproteobacteria bacterium]
MFFRSVAAFLFLFFAGSALMRLRASVLLGKAEMLLELNRTDSTVVQDAEVAAALSTAAKAPFALLQSREKYVQFLREYAAGATSENVKRALSSGALDNLTAALAIKPYSARYLINWLDINQLLKDTPRAASRETEEKVLELALTTAPNDPDVLYSAALLELWRGRREEALKIFSRVLMLAPSLTAGRRMIMAGEVRSGEDLEILVPPRFPQAASWSQLFKEHFPDYYGAWSTHFESLQRAAIEHAEEELRSGVISKDVFLGHLLSLESSASSEGIRIKSDRLQGEILGESPLGSYLSQRALLKKLSIVPAYLARDYRPVRGMLSEWQPAGRLYLDAYNASVGFFMAPGQTLHAIELRSASTVRGLTEGSLQLYSSDDNYEWKEVVARSERIDDARVNHTRIVIPIASGRKRYWKLNYIGASKELSFYNNIDELVSAYGVKDAG